MIDSAFQALVRLIHDELQRSHDSFGKFNSAHEGWAVIKEEVDELWCEVMKKPSERSLASMQAEAIQIAAMAVRFAMDLCPHPTDEDLL